MMLPLIGIGSERNEKVIMKTVLITLFLTVALDKDYFNFYNAHFSTKFYDNHLLELSHQEDSNKWSNIGFGEEITHVESIKVNFTYLIWYSAYC